MSDIEDLIQNVLDKNYNDAQNTFSDLMNDRIADAMDQEKIKVSAEIYNQITMDDLENDEDLDDDEDIEDDVEEEDDTDIEDDEE